MAARLALALTVATLGLTGVGLARHPARADDPAARPRYLNPLGVALDPEGRHAFVALNGADAVAEVDLHTAQVLRRIACGPAPRAVAYHLGAVCVADDEPDVLVIVPGQDQGKRVPLAQLPEEVRKALQRELPAWLRGRRTTAAVAVGPPANLQPLQPAALPMPHTSSGQLLKSGVFENVLVVNDERLTGQPTLGFGGFPGAGGISGFGGNIGGNQGIGGTGGISGGISGGIGGGIGGNIGGFSGIGGWGSGFSGQFGISGGIALLGRTAPLDLGARGAALPVAAVTHLWSDAVFVSAAGSDCVLHLDARRLRDFFHDPVTRANFASSPSGVRSILGFGGGFAGQLGNQGGQFGLQGGAPASIAFVGPPRPADYLVQRLPTQAAPGPMALSADGKTLVVCNVLADSLTVIECTPTPRVVRHCPLGGPPPDAARRGEILFHSARLAKNGRFACASCHPAGGTDGVPWHMPGGEDFARVPRPLHGVGDTAPYGWRGEDATLEVHVRKTLATLFECRPGDGEVSDLIAYLDTLAPPEPAPARADQRVSVERGRSVFEGEAGCARCHRGDTLQDGGKHDVGTGGAFDTPSLRGVGRRSPLMHDGRAANLAQLLQLHRPAKPGTTAQTLSHEGTTDLMTYLGSL